MCGRPLGSHVLPCRGSWVVGQSLNKDLLKFFETNPLTNESAIPGEKPPQRHRNNQVSFLTP
jgi:hypothetical protein